MDTTELLADFYSVISKGLQHELGCISFCGMSHSQLPGNVVTNIPHLYYRMHGESQLYTSCYSDKQLDKLAAKIKVNRGLPKDFPNGQLVYYYCRKWVETEPFDILLSFLLVIRVFELSLSSKPVKE